MATFSSDTHADDYLNGNRTFRNGHAQGGTA